MTTVANQRDALIAEFGTADIDLSAVAVRYLGMSPKRANEAASLHRLPFPTYRIGGQKAPRKVKAVDLARVIVAAESKARDEWTRIAGATTGPQNQTGPQIQHVTC